MMCASRNEECHENSIICTHNKHPCMRTILNIHKSYQYRQQKNSVTQKLKKYFTSAQEVKNMIKFT